MRSLIAEGEKLSHLVLDEDLCRKYREVTDYITLGIDSFKEKISTRQDYIGQLHAELVFLKDLRSGRLFKTGKSYPTSGQESGLVKIVDLKTHFMGLPPGKVLVLGCHDLNVFNPRSKNAKGWRKEVNRAFRELAQEEKP